MEQHGTYGGKSVLCVRVRTCVRMLTCVQKPGIHTQQLPPLTALHFLLSQGLLLILELNDSASLSGQWTPGILSPVPAFTALGLEAHIMMPSFYMGAGDFFMLT